MPNPDRSDYLGTIAIADNAADGADNSLPDIPTGRRRYGFYVRITGDLTNVSGGTGLANAGSILGAVDRFEFRIAKDPILSIDARIAQRLAERYAKTALPAVRAPDAAAAPKITLMESFIIWLSAGPNSINDAETAFLLPQGDQRKLDFNVVLKRANQVAGIIQGAANCTLTNVSVQVEDIYDLLVADTPDYQIFSRDKTAYPVLQKQTGVKIPLNLTNQCRAIMVVLDSDLGLVEGLISKFTFEGDQTVFFKNKDFRQACERQASDYGGIVDYSVLILDFQKKARGSTWLDPQGEDTNIRLTVDMDPTGLTNPVIRVIPIMFRQLAGVTSGSTGQGRALAARAGR